MLSETDEVIVAGTASSPAEAVEIAQDEQPDVVLLDWIMPAGGEPKAAADASIDRTTRRNSSKSTGFWT